MIEHMFGAPTAFRHYGCGGTIYCRERPFKTIFKCAACLRWSEDLLDLVKDPDLKTAEPDGDEQAGFEDLSGE